MNNIVEKYKAFRQLLEAQQHTPQTLRDRRAIIASTIKQAEQQAGQALLTGQDAEPLNVNSLRNEMTLIDMALADYGNMSEQEQRQLLAAGPVGQEARDLIEAAQESMADAQARWDERAERLEDLKASFLDAVREAGQIEREAAQMTAAATAAHPYAKGEQVPRLKTGIEHGRTGPVGPVFLDEAERAAAWEGK